MKSHNLAYKTTNLKYTIQDFFYQHKLKIFVCGFCIILGVLTGIFTAIKMNANDATELFEAFNITNSISDIEKFNENFFGRMFSYTIVTLLLFAFSQSSILNIFSYCLITYRAFLISINCVMLIIVYSFGGILKSIIIIFPCQLIMLCLLCLYFCFAYSKTCERKKYKNLRTKDYFYPIIITIVALSVVNLVETLLLFVFKSSVILVI